jgi:hypothetical protein
VNPTRRRHRQTLPTPPAARVVVPPAMRAPVIPPNRVVITRDLLRYAFQVHCADEHAGQLGRGCRTCKRYSLGIALAAVTEEDKRAHADVFELPTSALNAYADTMRPHVGGLPGTDRPRRLTVDQARAQFDGHITATHGAWPPAGYQACPACRTYLADEWATIHAYRGPSHGTINACRGTTTDPAPANTAATTAPPATRTSPPSKPPEPASAPNPSASNAPA